MFLFFLEMGQSDGYQMLRGWDQRRMLCVLYGFMFCLLAGIGFGSFSLSPFYFSWNTIKLALVI